MKIAILLLVYVALLYLANGAVDNGHHHGPNQELTIIHPFYIPPRNLILIRKLRNGVRIPRHEVYGTLHRVPQTYLPRDLNEPYGHVFVTIDEHNYFYARLGADPTYNHDNNNGTHNENSGNNTPNEVPEYHCYINRQPHRGLQATLLPVPEDRYQHDIPHVHYMGSGDIDVVGALTHVAY